MRSTKQVSPLEDTSLSSTEQLTKLSIAIRQNGIFWIQCAEKVSIFIEEANQCID